MQPRPQRPISARRWRRQRPSCLVAAAVAPQILEARRSLEPTDDAANFAEPPGRCFTVETDRPCQCAAGLLLHRGAAGGGTTAQRLDHIMTTRHGAPRAALFDDFV